MFHARPAGSSTPFYSPERDIVELFPRICKHAVDRLHQSRLHPTVQKIVEVTGLCNQDLVDAATALKLFINNVAKTNVGYDKLDAVWTDSGMDRVPTTALLALFFQIGVGSIHYYFKFAREVVAAGRSAPGADLFAGYADQVIHSFGTDLPSSRQRLMSNAAETPGAKPGCERTDPDVKH